MIDIDDGLLEEARLELGCVTMKDTVNEALRAVAERRRRHVRKAVSDLGAFFEALGDDELAREGMWQ